MTQYQKMLQNEIDTRVARKTGEDVGEIRARGFGLERMTRSQAAALSRNPLPYIPSHIDWDAETE